jgi:endonuclease YncB( thermonuclease family)
MVIAKHGDLIRKILASILFALSWQVALANELHGRVVGVSDGDTITILDAKNQQHKVRLAGIDAPEKSQAFGQASKKQLSELVFGETVVIDWQKSDRYGRVVGKVLLEGFDVCLEQIRKGMAWHYKKYAGDQSPRDQQTYAAAEVEARDARLGLWIYASPEAPWDYRHRGRSK